MSYQPLFQQPSFLVQPATYRFPTYRPVAHTPTYVQPYAPAYAAVATPGVLVTTTVQPAVMTQPVAVACPVVIPPRPAVYYPVVMPPTRY